MKVLLINSPYHLPDTNVHRTEMLGIEYLSSTLKNKGYDVNIFDASLTDPVKDGDLFYYGTSDETILDEIEIFNPDFIGISCHYSFSSDDTYRIAHLIKSIYDIPLVLGGLYVSVFTDTPMIDCSAFDYAIIGEGEETFPLLLDSLYSQSDVDEIEGVIYRRNNMVIVNKKSTYIKTLDNIPFPDRSIPYISEYMHGSSEKKLYGLGFKPALSLLTSRSCPYRCSYCNMFRVHGPLWRYRSAENVLAEIDIIVNEYKAEHMFIMDDNFTLNPKRTKDICRGIIKNGYKVRWNTPNGISAKNVDDEMAQLMKDSGCANVCIAIESGSEFMRKEIMHKNVSNIQIKNAVECFNRANIPVVGFAMVGMPGETDSIHEESYSFIKKLKLTSLVVSIVVPFPGTELWDILSKKGIIQGDFSVKLDNYSGVNYETEDFTKNDLINRQESLKNLFPGLGVLADIERNYK